MSKYDGLPGINQVVADLRAEIERLRADGSAARASIGRLVAVLEEIVFHDPKSPAAALARQAMSRRDVQQPGMTQEEVVAFTRAAAARTLLGEVGVSPPRQSDLDGFDQAKARADVQSPSHPDLDYLRYEDGTVIGHSPDKPQEDNR